MIPIRSISDLNLNGSYTYADYLTWQFGELVELIRGKITRRMSGTLDVHQLISGNLHGILYAYLRRQPCQVRAAPYDVRLTTKGPNAADDAITTVVQPDLSIICDRSKIDERGCKGAPDWIIEIVSPGTAARDWKAKFDLYEENGVNEYWIISPKDRFVSVFVRNQASGLYESVGDFAAPGAVPCATLPGLLIEWADIFDDGLPNATPSS
jgi:Uma2 family endonuclease